MKRIQRISIILLVIILGLNITSCKREKVMPPIEEPTVEVGDEEMISIAQYKEKYKNVSDDTPITIEEDLAIRAVVVGNDITGNIYKQIYVQDATGGISIGINHTQIFNDYHVGQEVVIKLKGLAATSYNGIIQIGIASTKDYRIPYEIAKEHIAKDEFANEEKVKATKVTIDQLTDDMLGTLIELENVSFEKGGTAPYAEKDGKFNATNHTLKDDAGNTLTVRNSKYSKFANDILPKGKGTVRGILAKYKQFYQLFIRSTDDCINFDGKEGNNIPTPPNPIVGDIIYEESFTSEPGKMTAVNVLGEQDWHINTKFKNITMSGFAKGTSYANEDWLISPTFDLTNATSISISFEHTISRGGKNTAELAKMKEEQTIWVSSNYEGDVKTATWTQLTISNWPSGTDWNFVHSGNIDLPADMLTKPKVVIAFKYTCTKDYSATWQLRNLKVASEGGKLAEKSTTPTPNPANPDPSNPKPPTPPTPPAPPINAVLGEPLFPGADFNDWATFEGSLNTFGLKFGQQASNGGIEGSGALHLAGSYEKNVYIFTATVPANFDATKIKKITFYIKGTADKSLSINVYNTNPNITYYDKKKKTNKPAGYVCYNLNDITTTEIKGTTTNSYTGTINVSEWTKITLDLTAPIDGELITLPTEVGKEHNLIAFKAGGHKTYDLYIDHISFE